MASMNYFLNNDISFLNHRQMMTSMNTIFKWDDPILFVAKFELILPCESE